jgi:hypothetical protein
MLNLNKVRKPLAKIDGGKYSGRMVSISDQFLNSNQKEPVDNLIQEIRQLKIANDSNFQHIPDTTKEREILYHRTFWVGQEYLHPKVFGAVQEEVQE